MFLPKLNKYSIIKNSIAGKKNVVIKGRRTWESTGLDEATAPNVINIVVSTTLG